MQALSRCFRPNPAPTATAAASAGVPADPASTAAGPSRAGPPDVETAQDAAETPSSPRPQQAQAAGLARRLQTAATQTLSDLQAAPFNQGFGVSQTTRSVHPGRVTVQSAEPKRASTVRQEGQAGPSHPRALRQATTAPARHDHASTDASADLLAALNTRAAWRNVVLTRFSGLDGLRLQLDLAVEDTQARCGLSHGETAIVAKALALACRSAPDAMSALRGIGQIRCLDDIRAMRADVDPDVQRGWRLAATLESVKGKGLDLIARLTDQPRADGAAPMSARDKGLVRAYLRAAQEVDHMHGLQGRVDPGVVYGSPRVRAAVDAAQQIGGPLAWPGRDGAPTPAGVPLSLAEKALLAIPDAANPAVSQRHGCEFAIHMLRAGMLTTDRLDPQGKPTEFALTESRAAKTFRTHLNRALTLDTGGLSGSIRRHLLHQDKTPFRAFDRIVSDDGLAMGYGLSHQNGIHDGRAVRDMIDNLVTALQRHGGPGGQALVGRYGTVGRLASDERSLRQATRLAILQAAQRDVVLLPRFGRGDALTAAQCLQVADSVATMLNLPAEGGDAPSLRFSVAAMVEAENTGLTPQTLLAWAGDVGGPADASVAAALATAPTDVFGHAEGSTPTPAAAQDGDEPDWQAFARGLARATGTADVDPPAPALRGATRTEAGQTLADMIRGEELGSGFVLSDAGTTQVTTTAVSHAVSGVLSHGALALGLDLGFGTRHQVSFESGVSTDRSYLRMGVTRVVHGHAGGGAGVGAGIGHAGRAQIGLSVSGDIQLGRDTVVHEGTVFGFPRHLSGGVGADRALSARKAQLAELLVNVAGGGPGVHGLPRPGNPEDQHSLVVAAYQAYGDEISVGRFRSTEREHALRWRGSVSLGASVGPLALGVPTARAIQRTTMNRSRYEDVSGTLRVTKDVEGYAMKASVATVMAGLTSLTASAEQIGNYSAASLLGVGGLLARESEIRREGLTEATVRIFSDDQQLGTSFATKAYPDVASMAAELGGTLGQFAADKSSRYHAARHAQDPAASIEYERQVLADFVGAIADERDLTATPQLYYEWAAPHVEATNLLEADADLSKRLGDHDRAQRLGQRIGQMHDDPALRQGRFAISANAQTVSESVGINSVAGLTHATRQSATVKSLRFT